MLEHTCPQLPPTGPRRGGPSRDLSRRWRAGETCSIAHAHRPQPPQWAYSPPRHRAHPNARYEHDLDPIEPGCGCYACRNGFTRSYLRHLDKCNEMLAPMLGTLHNLWYYQRLMAGMRAAIEAGTFERFRRSFYAARAVS